MSKLKYILKYLFSKKFRSVIKQIRFDVHLAVLRDMYPRVVSGYVEMLKNGY